MYNLEAVLTVSPVLSSYNKTNVLATSMQRFNLRDCYDIVQMIIKGSGRESFPFQSGDIHFYLSVRLRCNLLACHTVFFVHAVMLVKNLHSSRVMVESCRELALPALDAYSFSSAHLWHLSLQMM